MSEKEHQPVRRKRPRAPLSGYDQSIVALLAGYDVRTVQRYFRGRKVSADAANKLERALAEFGRADLIKSREAAAEEESASEKVELDLRAKRRKAAAASHAARRRRKAKELAAIAGSPFVFPSASLRGLARAFISETSVVALAKAAQVDRRAVDAVRDGRRLKRESMLKIASVLTAPIEKPGSVPWDAPTLPLNMKDWELVEGTRELPDSSRDWWLIGLLSNGVRNEHTYVWATRRPTRNRRAPRAD